MASPLLTMGGPPFSTAVGSSEITDGSIVNADVNASAAIAGTKIAAATDTGRGTVELATSAEALTGTDTSRAVTPAGLAASLNVSPILVTAVMTPTASTNFVLSQNSGFWFGMRGLLNGAQSDDVTWTVYVPGGTYRLNLFHVPGNDHGIYTVTLNGSAPTTFSGSADTIDGYSAGSTPTVSSITGLVLPSGSYAVKFDMLTKNASSSSYYGDVCGFALIRTA